MPSLRSGRQTSDWTGLTPSIPTQNRFSPLAIDIDTCDPPVPPATDRDHETVVPPAVCPSRRSSVAPAVRSAQRSFPDSHVIFCSPVDDAGRLSLRSLGPVGRAKAVLALIGDVRELQLLHSGTLRIVTHSETQVDILLRSTALAGIPVHFSPPRRQCLGFLGVISGVSPCISDSDLQPMLADLGIIDFERLKRRTPEGQLVDTWSVKASFPEALPPFVYLSYERCPVRPFIRRPLRCFTCHRYGHGSATCRSAPRCGNCGGAHGVPECPATASCCPSCAGPHPAWSSVCPVWRRAWRLEELRASGLTVAEATRAVSSPLRPWASETCPPPPRSSRPPCPSFSATTTSSGCATRDSLSSASTQPAHHSTVAATVQTDPLQFSDDSTQTTPTLTLAAPAVCTYFNEDDADGVTTIVFPLLDLQEFVQAAVQLYCERKLSQLPTDWVAITEITLDEFFKD